MSPIILKQVIKRDFCPTDETVEMVYAWIKD